MNEVDLSLDYEDVSFNFCTMVEDDADLPISTRPAIGDVEASRVPPHDNVRVQLVQQTISAAHILADRKRLGDLHTPRFS